jgi:hypothetical protein
MDTQIMEKRYDELSDFNLIYLINFERLNFEEHIKGAFLKRYELKVTLKSIFGKKTIDNPDLPQKVSEHFAYNSEPFYDEGMIYNKVMDEEGTVYVDAYLDATHLVSDVLDLPVLKYTIKTINSLIGKTVMTKDLLTFPGFKIIEHETYGFIRLNLDELTQKGSKVRSTKVTLVIEKDNHTTTVDLGVINYSIYGRRL